MTCHCRCVFPCEARRDGKLLKLSSWGDMGISTVTPSCHLICLPSSCETSSHGWLVSRM